MGLDHSNAFVRLSFDGLIAFCICRRDDYRCEMGMVQAEDHEPLISITRINPNGTRTRILRRRPLALTDHVRIVADRPAQEGVRTFPSSFNEFEFDRLSDRGDAEDFRWIMDLQGSDFHGPELRLIRDGGEETLLRPRITVPHAIYYTREKTQYLFRRIRHPEDEGRPIGKIADSVGADIVCLPDPDDENGQKLVTVHIGEEEPIHLLRNTEEGLGFRYSIKITNLCRRPGLGGPDCPDASDFPRYYDVAEDTDGIEFDLRTMHEPDDNIGKTLLPRLATRFPEFEGFRADGAPQVCALAFFGLANSIP